MKVILRSPSGVEQTGTVSWTGSQIKVNGFFYSFEQVLSLGFTIRKA